METVVLKCAAGDAEVQGYRFGAYTLHCGDGPREPWDFGRWTVSLSGLWVYGYKSKAEALAAIDAMRKVWDSPEIPPAAAKRRLADIAVATKAADCDAWPCMALAEFVANGKHYCRRHVPNGVEATPYVWQPKYDEEVSDEVVSGSVDVQA